MRRQLPTKKFRSIIKEAGEQVQRGTGAPRKLFKVKEVAAAHAIVRSTRIRPC